MNDGSFQPEPPRLIEEEGEAGELLRSVERTFAAMEISEPRAWKRLEARQRRRTAASWAIAAAAAVGLVASAGALMRSLARPDALPMAEEVATVEAEPVPKPPEPAEPTATASVAPSSIEPAPAPVAPRPVRTLLPTAPQPVEVNDEAACNRRVNAGDLELGLECFRKLSQRNGLQAEVALYKAAQLLVGKLADPVRALPLLEEYRQRFPQGAMRGEVAWLRVQSLRAAGRFDEALAASEALLATPVGRTLSSELHMLRGRIYQDERSDCARAATEFVALVGVPGQLGDEAELRRADCLERLGRTQDARAAYEQYLRRSDIGNEAKARDRLRALEVGGFRPEGRAP